MARPIWRARSANGQFRKRVPADIYGKAAGQKVTFTFPAEQLGAPDIVAHVTIGREVNLSLQARDMATVKLRHGLATAQFERFCDAIRRGVQPLTDKQVVALSGLLYRDLIADWEDAPGRAESWKLMRDLTDAAADDWRKLERMYGSWVDSLLSREGVVTDAKSRRKVVLAAAPALAQAARKLERAASRDYRPDPDAERFPAWQKPQQRSGQRKQEATSSTLTFDTLFEKPDYPDVPSRTRQRGAI